VATETHEDFSEPILPGKGASDYERYLRTDELLALQKTAEERAHPDELLFQTVHQSSELWLKLGTSEVARATEHLRAGEHAAALRLLRRAALCLQFITRQLDMLEQMSPWEYQTVREVLGHGSGFGSPGFRSVRRVSPPLGEAFRASPRRIFHWSTIRSSARVRGLCNSPRRWSRDERISLAVSALQGRRA
jgi:tryptophan 2,3-dioxygenase